MKQFRPLCWLLMGGILGLGTFSLTPQFASAGQTVFTLRANPEILKGTSLENRPLLYAPGNLVPLSSVEHWDPSASPDLLMEPVISPNLPFGDLDITPLLMQDLGWSLGTSSFTIIDEDEEGTGFTDPRPFEGAFGNDATTLGEARQNLMAGVLDVWANTLESPVDVDVLVRWQPLFCEDGIGAFAAGAETIVVFRNSEDELPEKDTWYHSALAESLVGENLSGDPLADGDADIIVVINSDIDEGCLGEDTSYYYGLDGNEPEDKFDLATILLHQLGHGLGFSNFTDEELGNQFENLPAIFDHYTFDETLGRNWVRMSAGERVFSATNDKNLTWNGPLASEGADNSLDPGTPLLEFDDSTFFVGPASFGAEISNIGVTGNLVCAYDEPILDESFANPPSIRDACDPLTNPEELNGNLAIVDRGTCRFATKAANLQAAGAIGVLIANDRDAPLTPSGLPEETDGIDIPVAGVSSSQGETLRSLVCPVMPPPNLIFAQWVNGEAGGMDNSVRLILQNQGFFPSRGTISFLSPAGELVSPSGEPVVDPIPYQISGFGTFEVSTPGTGALQNGVIEVRTEAGSTALTGTEIFQLLGSSVSVPNSPLAAVQRSYVSLNSGENSGLALFNPHPELWTRIGLLLRSEDGETVEANFVDLAPRQQVIGFVNEDRFFAEALVDFPDGFRGTLTASSGRGPKFAMLGLIQKADGTLIAVETSVLQ